MAFGNVLLIEQNHQISQTMELAFQRAGFRSQSLPWGEDIIDYLKHNPVDAVLLNIRQIGMTARSICQKIREETQFARFPLVIMYGKQGKENRIDLLKSGIDDFVPMPFTPIELVTITETRLRPFADMIHGDDN
jgi:two-component system, OmpR family, response regulator VanR